MALRSSTPALAALAALSLAALSLAACERGASSASMAAASDSARSAVAASDSTVRSVTPRDSATAPITSDTSDPTATVKAYLAAIRAHAATRDTMLWEPATGSDDGFRTFRDTTVAGFQVGTPGRIEGAAGSRYTDVPVSLDLATRSAPTQLRGTVTLRRAVVDGATDAQRRWRIVRIQWGAPTAPSLDSTSSHS